MFPGCPLYRIAADHGSILWASRAGYRWPWHVVPWPKPRRPPPATINLTQSPEVLTTGTDRHLALFDKCSHTSGGAPMKVIEETEPSRGGEGFFSWFGTEYQQMSYTWTRTLVPSINWRLLSASTFSIRSLVEAQFSRENPLRTTSIFSRMDNI
jgi:hypothetical protein